MRTDTVNPLVLAWVGDAVCHEYVRRYLVGRSTAKVHALERKSTSYVSAKAQSDAFLCLTDFFTEEEKATARRAENAHAGHCPKNATVEEYRRATALEAVVGSLRLQGDEERLEALLCRMIGVCEKESL